MALRVRPAPTRYPTNIHYTPVNTTPLHSIPSGWCPKGSEPMWRRPGNIHDFVLGGKSNRQGWATAQITNKTGVSGRGITTPVLCTGNLTTIARGRCSLATDKDEEARHISWAIELMALCLNNNGYYNNRGLQIVDKPSVVGKRELNEYSSVLLLENFFRPCVTKLIIEQMLRFWNKDTTLDICPSLGGMYIWIQG